MATLENRLGRLEREVRFWRWVGRSVVALLLLMCLAGARDESSGTSQAQQQAESRGAKSSPNEESQREGLERTIAAERIELCDAEGQTRIRMEVTPDGPAISLVDSAGNPRIEIAQSDSTAGLQLFQSGQPVATLSTSGARDSAQLRFQSSAGSSSLRADGLSICDEQQQRVYLSLINGNYPVLGLNRAGQSGPATVEMTASRNVSGWKLHDQKGRIIMSLLAAEDSSATILLRHPAGNRSLQISTGQPLAEGPRLLFFGTADPAGTGGDLPRLRLGLNHDQEPDVSSVDRTGRVHSLVPVD